MREKYFELFLFVPLYSDLSVPWFREIIYYVSGQLGLRNALCSQLSASEEELSQKQAYCPWKESNSTD